MYWLSSIYSWRGPLKHSFILTFCRNNRRAVSVNDIRRAFEKAEQSLSHSGSSGKRPGPSMSMSGCSSHNRMSSLDSTTSSEESSIPTPHFHGSVTSLASGHGGDRLKDHYGSITSLASSTSMISPQVQVTIMSPCQSCHKCQALWLN